MNTAAVGFVPALGQRLLSPSESRHRAGPVGEIEICDRRLAELAARRTARSAMFTDLILLGIGVTSILGTALAVTEFGRSMANDPGMAVYDLGRSSIMGWIAGHRPSAADHPPGGSAAGARLPYGTKTG